jgi:hypothetical protein
VLLARAMDHCDWHEPIEATGAGTWQTGLAFAWETAPPQPFFAIWNSIPLSQATLLAEHNLPAVRRLAKQAHSNRCFVQTDLTLPNIAQRNPSSAT